LVESKVQIVKDYVFFINRIFFKDLNDYGSSRNDSFSYDENVFKISTRIVDNKLSKKRNALEIKIYVIIYDYNDKW